MNTYNLGTSTGSLKLSNSPPDKKELPNSGSANNDQPTSPPPPPISLPFPDELITTSQQALLNIKNPQTSFVFYGDTKDFGNFKDYIKHYTIKKTRGNMYSLNLMWAIERKDTKIALDILNNTPLNINTVRDDGATVLLLAIEKKLEDVGKKILDSENVEIDYQTLDGKTPLIFAIHNEQYEVAVKLVDKLSAKQVNARYKDGRTALMFAIINKNDFVTSKLINKEGIDLRIQDDDHKQTALIWAIQKDNHKATMDLIEKSTPADFEITCKQNYTALMWAAFKNNNDIALAILEKIDKRGLNYKTNDGRSAFLISISNDNQELAIALIEKGAQINIIEKTSMFNGLVKCNGNVLVWVIKQNLIDLANKIINHNSFKLEEYLKSSKEHTYVSLLTLLRENDEKLNLILKHAAFNWKHSDLTSNLNRTLDLVEPKVAFKIISHQNFLNINKNKTISILLDWLCKGKGNHKDIEHYLALFTRLFKEYNQKETLLQKKFSELEYTQKKLLIGFTYDALNYEEMNNFINFLTKEDIDQLTDTMIQTFSQLENAYFTNQLITHKRLFSELFPFQIDYTYDNKNEVIWSNGEIAQIKENELKEYSKKVSDYNEYYDGVKNTIKSLEQKLQSTSETKNFRQLSTDKKDTILIISKGISYLNRSKPTNLVTQPSNTYMLNKLKLLTDDFKKCHTISYNPNLWQKLANFFKQNGGFIVTKRQLHDLKFGNNIQSEMEKINNSIKNFREYYNGTEIFINNTLHLDLSDFNQLLTETNSDIASADKLSEKKIQLTDWMTKFDTLQIQIKNLKKIKQIEKYSKELLQNNTFLNLIKNLAQKKSIQNLPTIIESDYNDDNNVTVLVKGFLIEKKLPPLKALIDYLEEDMGLTFPGDDITSTVSSISVTSIAQSIHQGTALIQQQCNQLLQSISQNFREGGAEQETIYLRKKHLGILLPFLKIKKLNETKTKELIEEIEGLRVLEHLQTKLTVKNSIPHTNKQEKLSKTNEEKVIQTFKEGLTRLNDDFRVLGLSEVFLTDNQFNTLTDIYLNNAKVANQPGSHYSIEGPFIIPDGHQIMSETLVIDRWIGLSLFRQLSKDITPPVKPYEFV